MCVCVFLFCVCQFFINNFYGHLSGATRSGRHGSQLNVCAVLVCACVCCDILLPSVRSGEQQQLKPLLNSHFFLCLSRLSSLLIWCQLDLEREIKKYAQEEQGVRVSSESPSSSLFLSLPTHSLFLSHSPFSMSLSSILRLALSIIHCPLLFGPHEQHSAMNEE